MLKLIQTLLVALAPMLPHHAGRSIERAPIFDAIAAETAEDANRGYVDAPFEAALLAYYGAKESNLSTHPIAVSWDARAHVSCGVWQEPCDFVRTHSLRAQVRWWLNSMHAHGLASVDSSPSRARRRLEGAWSLVTHVAQTGVGDRR